VPQARGVAAVFQAAGHHLFSHWEDQDVWASDFRQQGSGDLEPQGGSDLAELYYFSGHGTCQQRPKATDPDYLQLCSSVGTPNAVDIGKQIRWGDSTLQYAVIDASCPMDLVSLGNNWFPVFRGLHIALGHSGTQTADTLDTTARGFQFAMYAVGFAFFPHYSVGDAWMNAATTDIQAGCSAVALAAGTSRDDAVWHRDQETIGLHSLFNYRATWFAWKWRTA
jgi:hypothetical protein